MIARLLRSEDFERVLRTRDVARSAHFALHHLDDRPSRGARAMKHSEPDKLSTDPSLNLDTPVDDFPNDGPAAAGAVWLGAVVPKRHARRAVTRNLLKRQIRAVVSGRAAELGGGLWVVRLRTPIGPREASAASDELRRAARSELDRLLSSAARAGRAPGGSR